MAFALTFASECLASERASMIEASLPFSIDSGGNFFFILGLLR